VEEEKGPDHDKTFVIAAVINGKKMGIGQGPTKKNAEQEAAKQALIRMNVI
jgi:ribonuclease-3